MTSDVTFLIHDGFQILDLAGPMAAFQMAGRIARTEPYRLQVSAPGGGVISSSAGVSVAAEAAPPVRGGTLIVVGGTAPGPASPDLQRSLGDALAASGRIASVCTGAFLLAEAGALDGRRATTHWKYAPLLQRQYPRIRVEADRIFVRDGDTWTSAGISAGIDMALAMIEADLGPAIARETAQMLVVYHRRPGGQSQFSAMLEMQPDSDRMARVLVHARENLAGDLSVERLAEVACLSPRQFARAFRQSTGETPAKAVERLRAEAARELVEKGCQPIEGIAGAVGFGDPERMRRAFVRIYGQPPQALRRLERG